MAATAAKVPLSELEEISILNDQLTGSVRYQWAFSDAYPAFPTLRLDLMSIKELKECSLALEIGDLTIQECRNDVPGSENDDDEQEYLSNTHQRASSGRKFRKQEHGQAGNLVATTEKKLWESISKVRSAAFKDAVLPDLLTSNIICHPHNPLRHYKWKFTDAYPCFKDAAHQKKNKSLERWSKKELKECCEALDKGHLTFEVYQPDGISRPSDKSKPRADLNTNKDRPLNLLENDETIAVITPFGTVNSPGRQTSSHKIFNPATQLTEMALKTIPEGNARLTPTDPQEPLESTISSCFPTELRTFIATEKCLIEDMRKSFELQNSRATNLLRFSDSLREKENECRILKERLDKDRTKHKLEMEEFQRRLAELSSSLSTNAEHLITKARKEGQKAGWAEALEQQNRDQISLQLTRLDDHVQIKETAFEEGKESARQTLGVEVQILNEALGKAQAEIKKLKAGPCKFVKETVSKVLYFNTSVNKFIRKPLHCLIFIPPVTTFTKRLSQLQLLQYNKLLQRNQHLIFYHLQI